jgi:hypothetical protein
MRKLIASAVAVFMAGILTLSAADEAKKNDLDQRTKLATEMLETMQVGKMFENSFNSMKQMQTQMIKRMVKKAEDQDKAMKIQSEILDLMQKEFTWEKLKPDFVKLYAETFTTDELQGLIDFNKSPVGQKFIEKQPEMQRKSMMLAQKMVMGIMPKIQKLTKDLQKEVAAAQKNKKDKAKCAAPIPCKKAEADKAECAKAKAECPKAKAECAKAKTACCGKDDKCCKDVEKCCKDKTDCCGKGCCKDADEKCSEKKADCCGKGNKCCKGNDKDDDDKESDDD